MIPPRAAGIAPTAHSPARRRRRLRALLPAAFACLMAATTLAERAAEVRDPLLAGETLVRLAAAPAIEGWAVRIVPASADRVARVTGDWRHYAEFFPFVTASEAVVRPDGSALTHLTIDPPGPWRERRVVAVVEHRSVATPNGWTRRLTWRSPDGSTAPVGGEWTLREIGPDLTRVEIRLSGHLGLPAALERRALARTLPWVLDGLAQQVDRCRYDEPRHPTCREAEAFRVPSETPGPAPRR